jgi:hypothetical protein
MTFAPPKRKLFELIALPFFSAILYFIYPNFDAIVLFIFGFVWNWSASNELEGIFQNKRYKMSMLKMVVSLQNLFLRPFQWAPIFLKKIIIVLPAGLFWTLVILMNQSEMPWWATFVGSIVFELLQLELKVIRSQKEQG